ncbi:MAG TPA: patatin-like phospholipase family protein [Saprospiraceae bacterium]|nr:patatin-like phospholipase family protein [Saprospiraceae bacterium]HMQ83864.1 patatin-like phospholipase family protein [Saprospiraceae bacterium]
MDTTIKNLAFEGGGVKGITYAGALQVLDDKKILPGIERVAGTSAGAITACLVGLRYDPEYITQTIKSMDLGAFDDREGLLRKLHFYGLHPGDTFLHWIENQIVSAGLGLEKEATFEAFQAVGCRDIRVFASDIYTQSVREFSAEKTPKVIVAEAVRASMSIPLYFNAWQFSHNNPDDHLYVDGGMVYNYPLTAFDEGAPNWETIGFRLQDVHGARQIKKFGYGHWAEYVKHTFMTLLQTQSIDYAKDPEQVKRSVVIDDLGVPDVDFDISEAMKDKLIESGKAATEQFLRDRGY